MSNTIQIHLPITVGEIKALINQRPDSTIIEYATVIGTFEDSVSLLKNVLFGVTGIRFEDCLNSDKRIYCYMRTIFANKLRMMVPGTNSEMIAPIVNRSTVSVDRYFLKYEDESRYNPGFREILKKVDYILNNNVSQ